MILCTLQEGPLQLVSKFFFTFLGIEFLLELCAKSFSVEGMLGISVSRDLRRKHVEVFFEKL